MRGAPDHLTDGGWCQVLANWVIARGPAVGRPAGGWLADGLRRAVVQREVLDPAAYVELWLKDAGLHGGARLPPALRHAGSAGSSDQGIEARRLRLDQPAPAGGVGPGTASCSSWPYDVEQPIAPAIADWGRRRAAAVADDLAGARLWLRADVVQETPGPPGAEDPETIVLRQQRGCAAPARSTRSRRPWSAPATAT